MRMPNTGQELSPETEENIWRAMAPVLFFVMENDRMGTVDIK